MSDEPLLWKPIGKQRLDVSAGVMSDSPVTVLRRSSGRSYGSISKTACVESYIEHVVQKGETLQAISLKYNISVEQLKRINKLYSNEAFHLKDKLMVPCGNVIQTSTQLRSQDGAVGALDEIKTIEKKKSQSAKGTSDTVAESITPDINDIFSKFDSNIAQARIKADKLAQNSCFSQGNTPSPSGSEDSLHSRTREVTVKPPSKVKPRSTGQNSNGHLLLENEAHDQIYQL